VGVQSADEARKAFADAPNVTVQEVPINDGWARDWGPSVRARPLHPPARGGFTLPGSIHFS